jgi:hypothetical protein
LTSDRAEEGGTIERPIFIVGCQRSGRTLVRLMLDSHPSISCGPKTRFLVELVDAVAGDAPPPYLERFGFPEEYWWERVAELFDRVHSDYASRRGKQRWADKTGRYALHIDMLNRLFPDCQVVHVIRDGRDVVASHRRRFGYLEALKATRKWPVYVHKARDAGTRLGADRYIEIRYEHLVSDTEKTMRGLLDFLGEQWDPDVLDFAASPHDVSEKHVGYTAERRAADGTDHGIYRSGLGTGQRELDPPLRLACRLSANATLRELGYV